MYKGYRYTRALWGFLGDDLWKAIRARNNYAWTVGPYKSMYFHNDVEVTKS